MTRGPPAARAPAPGNGPPDALSDPETLVAAVRALHEDVRGRVSELLERARKAGRPELAAAPGGWRSGDLTYALDDVADEALAGFGRALGASRPACVVAEGPGCVRYGEGAAGAPVRVLVDPVDGTRALMHDMRPAWAVTCVAPDHGDLTRLSHAEVAVQTELPTTWSGVYHVLVAVRGRGATIARHDVRTGEPLEVRPLVASDDARIDNGYICFPRYLPVERTLVAEIERDFLERAIEAHDLSPRLVYEDQWLCNAGQMYLVATGRYRMLADLRGWIGRVHGLENFTAKPYDMAALLVYREAGAVVLDEALRSLDAPFDTETRLNVVAFANQGLADRLAPLLARAMSTLRPA